MDVLKSIVRIESNKRIGTGFVVTDDGLIITCAHVLGTSRPEKALVVFQDRGVQLEATVLEEGWRATDAEDVALLRINGSLPTGVHPLPLGSSRGTEGHSLITFGYPEAGEVEGVRGTGTIRGHGAETKKRQPLLQLHSSEITEGFSGAPVWDEQRRRVVGMVVLAAQMDALGKLGETAFATPTETLRAISSVLQVSDVCPYRELKVFTEVDAKFFHGRERVIETLVENLQNEPHFLALFGASGSGKSSVVQAGLIPRLRTGPLPGIDPRNIIITRPTEDTSFKQHLAHFDQATTSGVLVIDQFEELFISPYEEKASLEVTNQLTHLLEYSPRVTLIIVMRNDFYSLLMQRETLAMLLKGRVVNVWSTLKYGEVEAIVREPAKIVGWQFEEGLVEKIVDDVLETSMKGQNKGESSTILPLLEFTLTQLWEGRLDGILTHEVYHRIGGVTGGLKQWANEAYDSFETSLRPLVRRIFTDLVHLGNEEQHIPDSRRRRTLSTLVHSKAERADISHIIQHLVAKRLLVTSQDLVGKQERVEIIHDALLWEWQRLKQWVEEDRDFLFWHQELERRVHAWIKTNPQTPTRREKEKLLRGSELQEAMYWFNQRRESLAPDDHRFIQASQHRQQRRRTTTVISAVLLSGTAIGGGIRWFIEQMKHYSDVAIYRGHNMPVHCVTWSPEGSRVASGSVDRTVQVYFSHGEKIYTYRGHHATVSALTWSPDGYRVASASGDKTVQIWSSDGRGTQPPVIYRGHHAMILSLAWSPNGTSLASGSGASENLVHIWDANTLALLYRYQGHIQPVNGLAWSPDSTRIASASGDSTVHVWDVATGKLHIAYTGHQPPSHVISVAWSLNGQYIASAGYEGTVHIWSAMTGKTLNVYQGHGNRPVTHVDWSPDDTYIASASADKTVQIWTALEGKLFCTYDKHILEVECVAWAHPGRKQTSPIEPLIASSSIDTTVHIWKIK